MTLDQIRDSEKRSHIAMYTQHTVFSQGSWLSKPVKTVLDLFSCFENSRNLRVLDLGCGVGRNAIPVAQHFREKGCLVDCVDILDVAIKMKTRNAVSFDVAQNIRGILCPIDDFSIPSDHYDWVIAISALEHMDSKDSLIQKLREIQQGVQKNGIVCLICNTSISERNKETGKAVSPQFEINLPSGEMQNILNDIFSQWHVLKMKVQHQKYDIPRDAHIHELESDVLTYVARK